ncbi:hypothetical protein KAJ27_11075 [bacterium]|nr:hypothetical protein [bacterium]
MRKKIFIIHGKGVNNGIGRESGGDLDTISSNAFYAVWAQNFLKQELKREPVFGEDYDFEFINYSEGINHLAARSGCDIYIPDFPIDALSPRLKLMLITDDTSIDLLNRFTLRMDEYKMWMIQHASIIDEKFKEMFNLMYKQIPKVISHQESPVLKTANNVTDLSWGITELYLYNEKDHSRGDFKVISECVDNLMRSICSEPFYNAKENILELMKTDLKYEMSEIVTEKSLILGFDKANSLDMSTQGRIGYTDEFIILTTETVAYVVRGLEQLGKLPFNEEKGSEFSGIIDNVLGELRKLYSGMLEKMKTLGNEDPEINRIADDIRKNLMNCVGVIDTIKEKPSGRDIDKGFPVTVMLTEDATGRAVDGVEIVFERLKGRGDVTDKAGNSQGIAGRYITKTDKRGSATLLYKPTSENEEFLFNATFNELNGILIPQDVSLPDKMPEAKESNRAEKVSMLLIERMFSYLKSCDVNIVSIDDHHPYSPDILNLLNKLKDQGCIENIQIHAAPRGEEEPKEKQCCGADLIYKDRVNGKPWDNDGLAYLCHLAHMQDLHIEMIPLSIELSKLIGSGYNKIDMALGLSRVKDKKMMLNIMAETGWDAEVKKYEDGLDLVLPMTETNLAHLSFIKKPSDGIYEDKLQFMDKMKVKFFAPKDEKKKEVFMKKLYFNNPLNRMQVIAGLSPFTDPKKGQTKINVASAIGYLLGKRKHYADYFFYCYGSNIMTTRQPNENEDSINLSTLAQHVGTPADGGHKGAATCQPASNPTYPKKELGDVKEKNILEFFHYLSKKICEYNTDLEFYEVRPVRIEEYTKPIEKTLEKIKFNLIEYEFTKPGEKDTLKVLITKAPKVDREHGGGKPAITQILERVARDYEPDYIFFCQGGMYSVVLYNLNDRLERLDLSEIGKHIGWDEDSGNIRLTVCTPKRNRLIPKAFRWLRDDDFYEFARLLVKFINESKCKWKVNSVKPVPFTDFPQEILESLYKVESGIYNLTMKKKSGTKSSGPSKLKITCSLAPYIDKKSGELELSTTFMVNLIEQLKPDYFLYVKYRKMMLVNMNSEVNEIDCGSFLNAITDNQAVVSDEKTVASVDPSIITDLPKQFSRINTRTIMAFLEFIVGKLSEHTDYELVDIKKRPSRH